MDEFQQRLARARSAIDSLSNPLANLTDASTADEARDTILTTLAGVDVGDVPGEIDTRETRAAKKVVDDAKRAFQSMLESTVGGYGPNAAFVEKSEKLKKAIDDLEQEAITASNMTEGGRRRRKSRKAKKTRARRKGKKATRRR
jgi:hypothetical protein